MALKVGIVGATGEVGGSIVDALLEKGGFVCGLFTILPSIPYTTNKYLEHRGLQPPIFNLQARDPEPQEIWS
jgi:aspartate-semialdehyde dehydrogenase